jgi:hypothetical protein
MRSLVGVVIASALVASCAGSRPPVYLATGSANIDALIEGSPTAGQMRLKPSVCNGEPLRPDYERLNEDAVVAFLTAHGFQSHLVRARGDLVYVDVLGAADHPVRLRVAILPNPPAAGRDLHEAMLQHGPGSWGVHRSNLAILGPIGDPGEVVAFAAKTKLACWGVLSMAGLDDTFVTPGGYFEL